LVIMNEIDSKISEVLRDQRQLEKLLILEKEKRGLGRDKLVFLGISNTAEYYWCAMKSLFKSRRDEIRFFVTYLNDRIRYSIDLGGIAKLPQKKADWLDIGEDITFEDIELLLKRPSRQSLVKRPRYVEIEEDGIPTLVPAEYLFPDELKNLLKEKDTKFRGEQIESLKAERYPTIRWNFTWQKYVISGIPDGITDTSVYEFKSTRTRFLVNYVKPVALTQADLYGHFFRRDKKRVQIHIADEGTTKTWENRIDKTRVVNVIKNFNKVDEGWLPPPPKAWKCKSCEFKEVCRLKAV